MNQPTDARGAGTLYRYIYIIQVGSNMFGFFRGNAVIPFFRGCFSIAIVSAKTSIRDAFIKKNNYNIFLGYPLFRQILTEGRCFYFFLLNRYNDITY